MLSRGEACSEGECHLLPPPLLSQSSLLIFMSCCCLVTFAVCILSASVCVAFCIFWL